VRFASNRLHATTFLLLLFLLLILLLLLLLFLLLLPFLPRRSYAGVLTACQFATTAGAVGALGAAGVLKDVSCGAIKMDKVRAMAPINVVFYAAIFSNAKLLQHSNVETFIAFRSATPLLVASVDTLARGQALPSARTAGALALIAIGAVGYALADDGISLTAYFWAFSYLAIIVTEMVYAKHVVSSIGLTTWELVLYQNMIALCIWRVDARCFSDTPAPSDE